MVMAARMKQTLLYNKATTSNWWQLLPALARQHHPAATN
jgi:hypothetical protein